MPSSFPVPSMTTQPTQRLAKTLAVGPTVHTKVEPTIQPTPTLSILGTSFNSSLDLRDGPVEVPLELQIPVLNVSAPVLGVGITADNVMDAPKGPIGDPVWETAFWYRGSGIPGESGTATIAGHVTGPLGFPQIFAHLEDLNPGDVIIIRAKITEQEVRFIVDQTQVYSNQELTDPAVLSKIYGPGLLKGIGPQPALDGLSHLTLITCAGSYANGQFDKRLVVFATRSMEEPADFDQ